MTATTVASASLEPVTISEICSPAEVSARPASNTHMAPSPKEITAAIVTCLGGPGCWAYGFGSPPNRPPYGPGRSEEHTSELQSHHDLVCRLLLEKKKKQKNKGSQETRSILLFN